MNKFIFFPLILLLSAAPQSGLRAQERESVRFWSLQIPDSLHKARFWSATGAGVVAYGTTMTSLYNSWYADYPLGRFHFFNDMAEWQQMDKMGHWLMSYNESRWVYGGARWTGMSRRQAAWVGFAGGQLIQTSFEMFDGFSEQWGFSWGDVAFNTLGSGLFLGQELFWQDQRIVMKMSAQAHRFSNAPISPVSGVGPPSSLQQRADELYGTGTFNLFLKNYNTLAVWLSVNPRSFSQREQGWWPRWLNVAAGMGAENMFAGFGYEWLQDKSCLGPECARYRVDPLLYPRTRQWFLSLDVDLTRIKVRNRFLRAVLATANILKIPAPTLEINNRGRVRFHPLYF